MLVVVLGLLVSGSYVFASVIGTPHDLAPEPCAMCHTPHNASGQYPLWNREQATSGSYTMYGSINSPSFDMGVGAASTPGNPSNLCLVCHNGQFSSLVNYPGPCNVNPDPAYDLEVAGCANLELDLTNDHPISFTYNPALDASSDNNGFPNITNVTATRNAIVGAISGTYYYLYGSSPNNQFECATCHSVHDVATYDGKGSTTVYFLRHDNAGSTLCRDCHFNR